MNNKNWSIKTDFSIMALCSLKSVNKSGFLYTELHTVEEN